MSLRILACGVALGCVVLTGVACHNPITPTTFQVSSLVPANGSTIRATDVTINGGGFKHGATVTFGGVDVAVTGITSSTITAVAPIHSAGAVDVVVTNPDGQSARKAGGFSYVQPPSVSSVSPGEGSTEGGASLTVTGTGFQIGAKVTIDGATITPFLDPTATKLTFDVGAHAAGTVDVIVINRDGQSSIVPGRFAYVLPDVFDFNGNWSAFLNNGDDFPFGFVIQNNALVSLLCNDDTFVAFQPVVPVSHGKVSASAPDGVTFSARIVSAATTIGTIKVTPRCTSPNWFGWRDSSAAGRTGAAILGSRRGK